MTDGMVVGLLGYATVIVVVSLLNLLAGRSIFYTAALFGSALFYGLEDPAQLVITAGPVFAYNMVHLVAFLALGMLGSWMVAKAEQYPVLQYFVLVLLIFVAGHVYGALMLLAQPLLGDSAWAHIGIASVAAAAVMGWYLMRQHPLLRRELREIPMGEVPPTRYGGRG